MPDVLRRDFDEFLFAAVALDTNGFPVTVVTALARHDLDPWEEAASLARLSPDSAAQRLASLLTDLPHSVVSPADSLTIAARLVPLLKRAAPRGARPSNAPPAAVAVATATRSRRISPALYCLVALIILLIGQWISVSRQPQFPVNADPAPAPTGN